MKTWHFNVISAQQRPLGDAVMKQVSGRQQCCQDPPKFQRLEISRYVVGRFPHEDAWGQMEWIWVEGLS